MIRSLCFTLFLATASCATIAVATSSSPAPAATPAEPAEQPARNEGARTAQAVDACRGLVWPQIPAECMRSDAEGRARRAIRVIPIHGAVAR